MSENSALHSLLAEFAHPAKNYAVTFRVHDLSTDGEGPGVVVIVNFRRYNWYVSLERRPTEDGWSVVFEPSFSESIFDQHALSLLVADMAMIEALCAHLAAWEPGE